MTFVINGLVYGITLGGALFILGASVVALKLSIEGLKLAGRLAHIIPRMAWRSTQFFKHSLRDDDPVRHAIPDNMPDDQKRRK